MLRKYIILIFIKLKRYTYIEKVPKIKLEDYVLVPKDTNGTILATIIQSTFPDLEMAEITLYKEERKKYTLEFVKPDDKIDDGIDSAQVIVFESKVDPLAEYLDKIIF
jgi:hypothetical protein